MLSTEEHNIRRRARYASVDGEARRQYNNRWKRSHAAITRTRERDRANKRAGTGPGYRALWLNNIKHRARKKGIAFDLTLDDLHFPDVCPVLGIPLIARSGSFSDNSPSIDRIVPAKGYVKGNVRIISYRANRIKCHASISDLRAILAYMEREA